jgi:MFS transporter, ACS family, D-galactonate transporter
MASTVDSQPVPREQPATADRGWWRVVMLLMLVVALGHFNRIAISVAGTERIIPENGIDATRMGTVYTAFLFFYMLAMVPTGWLIDRFGARATLIVFCFGSAIFVAGTGGVGLCTQSALPLWIGLLAVRSLMGLVNAPLHPAAARMVFAHVPRPAKSLANGLVTFGACAGISATYYGFGALIDRFHWPIAFFMTALITLAVGLSWTWGTRDLPALIESPGAAALNREGSTSPLPAFTTISIRSVLLRSGVICLTLSYAALGYFQYLFFYWIEYYIGTIQHLGPDVSRRYSTFITLTMGLGMIFGGWLADRVSRSWDVRWRRYLVPSLGMIASGLVFELGAMSTDSHVMVAAFTCSAGLLGICEAAFWTTIVELGSPRGGLAAGLMNMGGNAGGLLSPVVTPWLSERLGATPWLSERFGALYGDGVGWRASLGVAGAISVIGALLWLGVKSLPESE